MRRQSVSVQISMLTLIGGVAVGTVCCNDRTTPPPPPATVTTGVSGSAGTPMSLPQQRSATQPASPAAASPQSPATAPSSMPGVGTTQPAKGVVPPGDPRIVEFAGLRGPKPATWEWRPVSKQFAVAEYSVPGVDGADLANIVVFSPVGGPLDMNVERWRNQFKPVDGKPVDVKRESFQIDGMDVVMVEIAGEYRGMMGGWTPDTLFLTAVIQAPDGQTFVRFTGPRITVEKNRAAFMEMIRGLKKTGS